MADVKPAKVIDINSQVTYSAITAATNLCNEATTRSVKTPISLLQEICMKCSISPSYEVVSTEGQVHEPIFIYKVSAGDIMAFGKGNSKKKAKHSAALAILNEIKEKSIGKNDMLAQKIEHLIKSINDAALQDEATLKVEVEEKKPEVEASGTLASHDSGEATSANPIGELLELTQKLALRPPTFEFGDEEGPPHNRQFVCHIKFGEHVETGLGRAKKIAKRQAALKLLAKLKSCNEFVKEQGLDTLIDEVPSQLARGKKNAVNGFTQLKQSSKPTITQLLSDPDLNEDLLTKSMLDALAKEEGFEFSIFRVPQKNKAGLHQVLLQIKLNPTTVVSGAGITLDEALQQASYNALTYIKLLCSR